MVWVIQTYVKNNNHWSDGDDAVNGCGLCILLWSSFHVDESVFPGISTWSGICHEWKTENERALCACLDVQQRGHDCDQNCLELRYWTGISRNHRFLGGSVGRRRPQLLANTVSQTCL
ncbi:unnamed protein product [Choristocarpus tenellus]